MGTTPPKLIDAVDAFFARHAVRGKRVAIGLSGGLDSMVLLETAHRLKSAWTIDLSAIHVHHGLSANADVWADFCARQCSARGIPLTVCRVTVDRAAAVGVEAAAREQRYAALAASASEVVLLAQHSDDQAETVLHQLLRGTGPAGLAAMGESRLLTPQVMLLRPLLTINRAELENCAEAWGLEWIHDESNDDTRYTRNFIRHRLVPVIAERFSHYRESLARSARHAAETVELTEALAKIDLGWDGRETHVARLDDLPLVRQVNALYHWLRWQDVAAPSREQLEEWARQLFRESPAGKPHQAGGHDYLIRRSRNQLQLMKKD
ncbi:MAG: tRNA lysidine(34) synthetase TilS [Betaproteobacteria bacterium]|nr:tRNA lysidine(34) synthetase TilS [Betaproteobacteria bacterium]